MSDYKTAIYCRLAPTNAKRIAEQEENLRRYVEENGSGDFAVYRDNGWGGSTLDRPAMKELMNGINSGQISHVVILDLSRISRNFLLIRDWLNFLERNGTKCITLDEGEITKDYLRWTW